VLGVAYRVENRESLLWLFKGDYMRKLNIVNEVVMNCDEIERTYQIMANRIYRYYTTKGIKSVVGLVVLNGAEIFASDLSTRLKPSNKFKLDIQHMRASSYKDKTNSTGEVVIDFLEIDTETYFRNKHVLIIDDIYDEGHTLYQITERLRKFGPASIEHCVLLERSRGRFKELSPRFIGRSLVTHEFLIGYGLDYKGRYRELPYIATVNLDKDGNMGEDVICNKCGETCRYSSGMKGEPKVPYGLIGGKVRGHYNSPVLWDLITYRFDICEKCLDEYFNSFKIPVEKFEYCPLTGLTIEEKMELSPEELKKREFL
jgi:hypoxanthine phosphoribosyltransferase